MASSSWTLFMLMALLLVAVTVAVENKTEDGLTGTTEGFIFESDPDSGLFGTDDKCTPEQREEVFNCSSSFENDIDNWSNDTLVFFDKFDSMFDNNPLVFGPSKLLDETTEPPSLPAEWAKLAANATGVIDLIQQNPNKTKEIMMNICDAIGKGLACADGAIKGSDCKPIVYRFAEVFKAEFCDPAFLNIFIESTACIIQSSVEPKLAACVDGLNETINGAILAVFIDSIPIGEAICSITNKIYDCFANTATSCSPELLDISGQIGAKFVTAMFDYDCKIGSQAVEAKPVKESEPKKEE